MSEGLWPVGEILDFIEDLGRHSGGGGIRFYIDDRDLDERAGPALAAYGCVPDMAETFLAHTGGTPSRTSGSEDVSVEAVDGGTIEEAVKTAMKGFADSEAEPDGKEFRQRLALRRAEMGGAGRFLLARVSGERGCRSTVINADEAGRPAELYRAAGFTDEVYWRRKYRQDPTAWRFH